MQELGLEDALARSRKNPQAKWPQRHTANRLEPECWPGLTPSFKFEAGDKIFTIGSCFARNIERHLVGAGFNIPTRKFLADAGFDADTGAEMLNKYTPPSIFQELSWTWQVMDNGGVVRAEDIEPFLLELKSGRVIDLQRRFTDRFGSSREEALEQRQMFFDLFKQAFDAQVVIITLGLVECWWDARSEQYIEMSAALAEYNEGDRFRFRRLDYPECLDFTRRSIDLLNSSGAKRILITTSPIPIVRTFTADDVIVANTYSKSVLRAVAGKIAEDAPGVDYFPSYENVMLTRRPELWADDLAHIEPPFIERIMRRVQDAYVADAPGEAVGQLQDAVSHLANLVKHQQWGQAGEALARIATLRDEAPDHPLPLSYYLNVAAFLAQAGQPEGVREHLARVMQFRSELPLGLQMMRCEEAFLAARLFDGLGEAETADTLRREGLAMAQDRAPAIKSWIKTLISADHLDDALYCLAYAETRLGDSIDMLDFLGRMNTEIGRLDEADRLYRRALELEPDNTSMLAARAGVLVKLNRSKEAGPLLAQLEQAGEPRPSLLRKLAGEYLKARRLAEAEALVLRLVEAEPDNAQNHAVLARWLMASGRVREAHEAALKAQALQPDERYERLIAQTESAMAVQARREQRLASVRKDADATP